MKKRIIKRLEEFGYTCKVEYWRDPFWYCNYEITVHSSKGQFLMCDAFGYYIDAKTGIHTKEEFEKDINKFIEEIVETYEP